MKLSRFATAAGSVVLLAVTAACSAGSGTSDGSPTSGAAGSGDTSLTVGLVAEPVSLDFTTKDGAAIPQALLDNVYETLVKVDQSGELKPALATAWKVSADNKTYTFDLVGNAKFTNGTPFTAKDAVFSINRVKSDWTVSLKAAMDVVADAKAVSDTQLQVTLSKPSNNWLYKMSTRIGAMMTETGVADLANKPVGTGPVRLRRVEAGRLDQPQGQPRLLGDQALLPGRHPQVLQGPVGAQQRAADGDDRRHRHRAGAGVAPAVREQRQVRDHRGHDQRRGGPVVQQRQGAVRTTSRSARRSGTPSTTRRCSTPAGRVKAPSSAAWCRRPTRGTRTSPALYPYDLDKAKALVAETGVAAKPLRLRVPSLPYATSCGQVVKSQLEQAGFKVALDTLEFPAVWLTTVFNDADYDMSIVAHVEPRDLPAVFGNPTYYTRYDNKQLQADLAAADAGTPEEQVTLMKQAARELSQDAAADFLFLLPNLMVAEKGITGLPKNAITESFRLSDLSRG